MHNGPSYLSSSKPPASLTSPFTRTCVPAPVVVRGIACKGSCNQTPTPSSAGERRLITSGGCHLWNSSVWVPACGGRGDHSEQLLRRFRKESECGEKKSGCGEEGGGSSGLSAEKTTNLHYSAFPASLSGGGGGHHPQLSKQREPPPAHAA